MLTQMVEKSSTKGKRTLVRTDPFRAFWSFIEYTEETTTLVDLTTVAFTNMTGMGRLASVLHKGQEEIAHAEELERLALDEVARGFPLLMSHTAVGLWSALEAALSTFAVDWLCYRPALLQGDHLSKTKVPAQFLAASDFSEAAAFVIDEHTRQSGGYLKQGIGRFTVVLEALGICATVDDEVRKTLFELSKVRNLYAHRFGVVDMRLKEACPWIDVEVGQRLRTSREDIHRYGGAVREYAACVIEAARDTMSKIEWAEVQAIHDTRDAAAPPSN